MAIKKRVNELMNPERVKTLSLRGVDVLIKEGPLPLARRIKAYLQKEEDPRLTVTYPKSIQISLNKTCNLNCTFCARQTEKIRNSIKNERRLTIPASFFEKNALLFKHADYVNLAADGEPLTHPEIKEILHTITGISEKPNVIFVTNGVLLDDEIIDLLVEKEIREVHISIDSLNKEHFKFLRPGVDLDKLLSSIRKLNEKKKEKGKKFPELVLRPTFISLTIDELSGMIDFCHSHGFDGIIVQFMQIYKKELTKYSLVHNKDAFRKNVEAARKKADALKIGFLVDTDIMDVEKMTPQALENALSKMDDVPKVYEDMKVERLSEKCRLPWEYILIQTNGDIHPCCHSRYFLGNIYEDGWEEIWNGERAKKLRRMFLEDMLPKECVNQPCGIGRVK